MTVPRSIPESVRVTVPRSNASAWNRSLVYCIENEERESLGDDGREERDKGAKWGGGGGLWKED